MINEELDTFKFKPLMKALFFISSCFSSVDLIITYIFALFKGNQLLKLLNTREVCIIDRNTKLANIIIVLKIIIMNIIGCIISILTYKSIFDNELQPHYIRIVSFMVGYIGTVTYMIGSFLIPVLFAYISWIVTSQINLLRNNISRGT